MKKRKIVNVGDKFPRAVKSELIRAYTINGHVKSLHEGYALILEELDEAWEEIKKKPKNRDMKNLLLEFVQIGSMAQKIAEDMILPYLDIDKHNE